MASTALTKFFEQNPSIKHFSAGSAEYESIRPSYVSVPYKPSVIARPQTADDVAAIVAHCANNDIPFVVRGGGHDVQARSTVPDILQIDMRDINYVNVTPDKETAVIGGGVVLGKLLEQLEEHQLMAPTGTVYSVGYVGWATLGGYGPLSPRFGLGIDQIMGATVINAQGKAVVADKKLLEAIRGGGGSMGIIVEMTIKVYPLQEIQAGMILYESKDLASTATAFLRGFNELVDSIVVPNNLDLQPSAMNIPGIGIAFMTTYAWVGTLNDDANQWHRKISALAPVMVSTVKPTTPRAYVSEISSMTASVVYPGLCETVTLRGPKLSASAIETFAKYAELQPTSAVLTSFHSMHGSLTEVQPLPSVFRNREPHYVLEIVGLSTTPEGAEEGKMWATEFADEMRKAEGNLESTHVSMTPKDRIDLAKIYGDNLSKLLELKKERDPDNVFSNTSPPLKRPI